MATFRRDFREFPLLGFECVPGGGGERERSGREWSDCRRRRKHENVIKFDVSSTHIQWLFERKIMLFVLIITSCVSLSSLFMMAMAEQQAAAAEYKKTFRPSETNDTFI